MNYIEKVRSLVNTFKDKDFFIINKISSVKKGKAEFTIRANQNFIFDMKSVLPVVPYYFRNGGAEYKNFEDFYKYLSSMSSFDGNQFLRNPDSRKHKICINLPESEEHLVYLHELSSEEAYKFLNPKFLSNNPLRGGYHARTGLTIYFSNVYLVQTMVRFLKNGAKKETLDKLKEKLQERLDMINYALEYIGGYHSDHHKVVNKSKVMEYVGELKNVLDNCTIDDIIQNDMNYIHRMFGKLSFRSELVINIYYKNESDLLHFLFLKDNPNIHFSQTVIFRPLKEVKT
jgi:hypothetical protein